MMDLQDNVYNRSVRRDQPKMKLWRSAGILLTYRCNCRCAFCYYNCGPDKGGLIPVDLALAVWQSLQELAGEHARIHLTGGEPFLYWERLLEILQAGQKAHLGPVDMIETNGFWAQNEQEVAERLHGLSKLGMQRLKVSCDPFHQQFVDIEQVRLLVRVARRILGPERVLVRWQEDLDGEPLPPPGSDTYNRSYLNQSATRHPCRFTGRAADILTDQPHPLSLMQLQGACCPQSFLGAKGVHIDPFGNVFSGTCSGILVGNVTRIPLSQLWRDFNPLTHPIIKSLCMDGPVGLRKLTNTPLSPHGWVSKCHLCTTLRRDLLSQGQYRDILGPMECYTP